MKKFVTVLVSIAALMLLASCEEKLPIEKPTTNEPEAIDEKLNINDLLTIEEAVNKEEISPNGEKVHYVYEVPVIQSDKPGAEKINEMFRSIVEDLEARIDDGQLMPLHVDSEAFLNDGVLSIVMDVNKTGSEGIYVVNYDSKNDKELSTRELLEQYSFDPERLITEINKQSNDSQQEEEVGLSLDYFIDTILTNSNDFSSHENYQEQLNEILAKPKEEQESYIVENIDKIDAYLNQKGEFVFIHRAALEDQRLIVP